MPYIDFMWHGLQLNSAETVRADGSAKELHRCGGDAAAERRRVVAGIDVAPARAKMPNLWPEVRLADGAVWSCTWLTALPCFYLRLGFAVLYCATKQSLRLSTCCIIGFVC
jgi:hypothetical protein